MNALEKYLDEILAPYSNLKKLVIGDYLNSLPTFLSELQDLEDLQINFSYEADNDELTHIFSHLNKNDSMR